MENKNIEQINIEEIKQEIDLPNWIKILKEEYKKYLEEQCKKK